MKKLPILLAAGALAIGFYAYKTQVPSKKLLHTTGELVQLRRNLERCYLSFDSNNLTWCSGQYETAEEIIRARRQVIQEAGCKDDSEWRIRASPDTIETRTVLADCFLGSQWTLEPNDSACPTSARLVPFGYLAKFFGGYTVPIADTSWWTKNSVDRQGVRCIRP